MQLQLKQSTSTWGEKIACTFAKGVMLATLIGMVHSSSAQVPAGDRQSVIDTVTSIFTALHDDSSEELRAVTTPDFYLFDNGTRFTEQSVLAYIKDMHTKGVSVVWKVTEPDVHISGDDAWITYVNQGSITKDGKTVPQSWLESANLHKASGHWLIEFVHSTRSSGPVQATGAMQEKH